MNTEKGFAGEVIGYSLSAQHICTEVIADLKSGDSDEMLANRMVALRALIEKIGHLSTAVEDGTYTGEEWVIGSGRRLAEHESDNSIGLGDDALSAKNSLDETITCFLGLADEIDREALKAFRKNPSKKDLTLALATMLKKSHDLRYFADIAAQNSNTLKNTQKPENRALGFAK